MKKILLFLLLPLLAVTFNSCSFEEGAKSEGDGNTKLVKTMTVYNSHDNSNDLFEYFYDGNQRIIRIDCDGWSGRGSVYYTYENNRIIESDGLIYTLDDNGYLIRIDCKVESGRDYYAEMEYSNGYLSKYLTPHQNLHNYYPIFTWEAGNLTKISFDNYYISTSYSNLENKLNIQGNYEYYFAPFTFKMLMFYVDGLGGRYVLYVPNFIKFKGMSSKNLPVSSTIYDSEGDPEIHNYSYAFDSDGYIIQITCNYSYYQGSTPETIAEIVERVTITYY